MARGFCKQDYRRWKRWGDDPSLWPKIQRDLQAGVPEGFKRCRDCDEVKAHDQFSPVRRNRDGLQSYCRPCQNERAKASWANGNEQQRDRRARRTAAYSALRKYGPEGLAVHERRECGEGCDICGRVTIRMAIDHCHTTGKVRGLLCKDCNTALGIVEESPERLRALIAYIEQHREEP